MTFDLTMGISTFITIIASLIATIIAVKVAITRIETKIEDVKSIPERVGKLEQDFSAFGVEIRNINRRLGKIDELKLDARLASIDVKLANIETLIKSNK